MTRIAVVDEDRHIRELYRCEFSEIGYEVLAVPSGTELMAEIESFRPDLLVLDIKWGDPETPRMLKKIRGLAPELPVVVCSAYDLSRWDFGAASPDLCLVKSFDLTGLKAKVERVLEAKTPFLNAV